MISETQLPQRFRDVIDNADRLFEKAVSITDRNEIPDSAQIPLGDASAWFKIPDVVCVFVDMKNSTKMTADHRAPVTAAVYQYFSGTAVRLFHEFEAAYIDVRGDAVFALFNRDQTHRALAAAVTMKTFVDTQFVERAKAKVNVQLGAHIGIDRHTVLVKRIGLRWNGGVHDRQNEVWAGQAVNMAAKLSSRCEAGSLLASDRFHDQLRHAAATKSCGCPDGTKAELWTQVDLTPDTRFGFKRAFELTTRWCQKHGKEFCEALLKADASGPR